MALGQTSSINDGLLTSKLTATLRAPVYAVSIKDFAFTECVDMLAIGCRFCPDFRSEKFLRATSSPSGSLWLQNFLFIRKILSLLRCVYFRLTQARTLVELRARAESAPHKAFRALHVRCTLLHYSRCSYTFAT